MANLSNINGKFVVEQTTGYVGVGTTDPNYPIEVLNASAEIALNASGGSIYRVQSDSASNFIIKKEGVGDRLVINSAGNATFAGDVALTGSGAKIISAISSDNDSSLFLSGAGSGKDTHIVYGNNRALFLSKSSSTTAVSEGTPVLTLAADSNATFAGNVGIGITPNNGYKLDVFDATEALFRVRTSNAAGIGGVYIGNGDKNWSMLVRHSQTEAYEIRDETENATRFAIDGSGNAMIGGTTTFNGVTGETGFEIYGNTAQLLINNPSYNHFTIYSASDSNIYNVFGSSGDYLIGTGNKNTSSWSEKMRIDSSGQTTLTNISGNTLTLKKPSGAALNWNDSTQIRAGIHGINGADGMQFLTGSSQTKRMTIQSNGNIGIGTENPDQKLEVVGSIKIANSNSRLVFGAENGTDRRALEGNTSGSLLQIGESYTDIALQGNVGIGTTGPGTKLDIAVTPSAPWMKLINEDEPAFNLTTYNNGTNNGSTVYAFKHGLYYGGTENAAIAFYRGPSSVGGFLAFTTDNGTERMRITSGGSVEIPQGPLHLGSTATVGPGVPVDLNSTELSRGYMNLNRDDTASIKHISFSKNGALSAWIQTGPSDLSIGTETVNFNVYLQSNLYLNIDTNNTYFNRNNVHIAKSTPQLYLDGRSFGNSGAVLNILGWAATYKNWAIANATSGAGTLNFRVSSAAGGNSGFATVGVISESTGAYTAVSDINKKKDFEKSEIGLKEVMELKPKLYRMKDDDEGSNKHLGFIAQEVKEVIPQAYVEEGEFIGLNERAIIAALTKAIQELKADNDSLKARIETLENN